MLILNKTRINILVDVHFLIPTFQVVLIHINKVGNRINKVGHETTKWVNESTKWVNESTSWTAPNQPRGSRQLYDILGHGKKQGLVKYPSQSRPHLFHPRPQSSRFKAKTWLHNFKLKRLGRNSTPKIIKWIPLSSKLPKKWNCECFTRSTNHKSKGNVNGCAS